MIEKRSASKAEVADAPVSPHAPGQIDRELDTRKILAVGGGIALATVVACLAMALLFRWFLAAEVRKDEPVAPLIAESGRRTPPEPHLQTDPRARPAGDAGRGGGGPRELRLGRPRFRAGADSDRARDGARRARRACRRARSAGRAQGVAMIRLSTGARCAAVAPCRRACRRAGRRARRRPARGPEPRAVPSGPRGAYRARAAGGARRSRLRSAAR